MDLLGEFEDLLGKFDKIMSTGVPLEPSGEDEPMDFSDNISENFTENFTDNFTENSMMNDIYEIVKSNFCDECKLDMRKDQMPDGNIAWICPECAKQGEFVYEFDSVSGMDTGYNTSDGSCGALFISGMGNPGRSNIVSTGSSYKKLKEKNTRQQLENIISQADDIGISKVIIRKAISAMLAIQEDNIYRGDVRKGTMAACLYRVCKSHNSPLKNTQIAKIFGIDSKTLSEGDKKICRLISKGSISSNIFTSTDTTNSVENYITFSDNKNYMPISQSMAGFIKRYFESLNIPEVYRYEYTDQYDGEYDTFGIEEVTSKNILFKEFAARLIQFITYFRICASSTDSSKCAGVIYIIISAYPELKVTTTAIEKECSISKTTFIKIVNAVRNLIYAEESGKSKTRAKLRHLFKKYDMPYDTF